MRKIKKRQKMQYKVEQNSNQLVSDRYNRYCVQIESDKAMIQKLYAIPNKESNILDRFAPFCSISSSMKASKQLLRDMMECNIKTKHCGYLHAVPKKLNEEEKSMRMEVDGEESEQ